MALTTESFGGTKLITFAALLGVVGLALWGIGLSLHPAEAYFAWLTAFAYATSLSLGALLFLMIGYVTAAKWAVAVRRFTESIAGTFLILLVAFIPVVVGAKHLYIWVAPPAGLPEHVTHLLHHKAPYLNLPFFAGRGFFYLLVWVAVALLLRRLSARSDQSPTAPPGHHPLARALSAALLPLVGLTLTFAAFDWLMSLQPAWFSTMFGVYYFAGGFVASLGLLTLLTFFGRRNVLKDSITRHHFHALGRLMFAFSIFWAYIAFFQALLINLANKPEEVVFYLDRIEGGWLVVVWLLIIGRFAIPFFVLLPRSIKHRPAAMAVMGGWILLTHYVDIYWLVVPMLDRHGPLPNWIDLAAVVGVTGSCIAFAAWRLRGKPLLPVGDPLLQRALEYRSPL